MGVKRRTNVIDMRKRLWARFQMDVVPVDCITSKRWRVVAYDGAGWEAVTGPLTFLEAVQMCDRICRDMLADEKKLAES